MKSFDLFDYSRKNQPVEKFHGSDKRMRIKI